MKISELIKKLEEAKVKRGDIDVAIWNEEEECIDGCNFLKYYPLRYSYGDEEKECIVLNYYDRCDYDNRVQEI